MQASYWSELALQPCDRHQLDGGGWGRGKVRRPCPSFILSFLLPIVHPPDGTFFLSPVFQCLKNQDGARTKKPRLLCRLCPIRRDTFRKRECNQNVRQVVCDQSDKRATLITDAFINYPIKQRAFSAFIYLFFSGLKLFFADIFSDKHFCFFFSGKIPSHVAARLPKKYWVPNFRHFVTIRPPLP